MHDFRSFYKIVKPVSFPLPLMDGILCLHGKATGKNVYFTTFDWRVDIGKWS